MKFRIWLESEDNLRHIYESFLYQDDISQWQILVDQLEEANDNEMNIAIKRYLFLGDSSLLEHLFTDLGWYVGLSNNPFGATVWVLIFNKNPRRSYSTFKNYNGNWFNYSRKRRKVDYRKVPLAAIRSLILQKLRYSNYHIKLRK